MAKSAARGCIALAAATRSPMKHDTDITDIRGDHKLRLFIVGMNGSGTTMLADCLGRHPSLYMYPDETFVLPYVLKNLRRFGDLSELSSRRKLAGYLGRCASYWQINGERPLVFADSDLVEPGVTGVFDAIYLRFARAEGKSMWGDKTPMYVQHIELLAKHVAGARFIHICRDGRDVARSMHRRWRNNPFHTIYRWKKAVQMGREQGRDLGSERYLEVRYEDVCGDPEAQMRQICSFLGLPFHPAVLESSMPSFGRFGRTGNSDRSVGSIVDKSGGYLEYFDRPQLTRLETIAGRRLCELRYAVEGKPGDLDPSASEVLLWKSLRYYHAIRGRFQNRRSIPRFLHLLVRRSHDVMAMRSSSKY